MTNEKKKELMILLIVLSLVTVGSPLLAAGGDSLTEGDIEAKIASVIKMISGWSALIIASGGLIAGGYKFFNGSEGAMKFIIGSLAGAGLASIAWGGAKLFLMKFAN